ncbi:LytR/AlgR family response regulator transcription factor [Clostridium peptidivorans]|uniref:LytR/AlgR family response regulator transcription factor n=1 Tax=Clostridium peptidivorans TaxID=100174 RepID=UPI000BE249CC|nr:LytTR family DNA-binding domain-containing protein [Clostridium peptidivorans]
MFRIAICDDESMICGQIEDIILKVSNEISEKIEVEVFYSGEELCEYMLNQSNFDLIFLDIELKLLNGVEVGRKIREEMKNDIVQIVYISGKQGYAMDLFEIRPMNFLVKPLSKEKITQVVKKFIELSQRGNQFFEFNSGKTLYKIPLKDILYFESEMKKIRVITKDSTKECYRKLSDVQQVIGNSHFLFIHKSYLVNYFYVAEYQYDSIKLTNGDILPISQNHRKDIRQKLLNLKKGRK